jgi:hypothetical protein
MLHKWIIVMVALISGTTLAAENFKPKFDPSQLKGPEAGIANEVLVLGTAHLSQLPANFDPKSLAPLITRLETWKPQIITVEAVSGAQCDYMRRYNARYADTVKSYCWDPTPARDATGLEVPAAVAEVERLLAAWPLSPTPGERRHLAAVFLAAGERTSALVQWLRLPLAEQQTGDGLNATLVTLLQKLVTKRDEKYLIAAPLAARLGLERVYATDDHTADSAATDEADQKAANEIIQRLWDNPATAKRKTESDALESKLGSSEGLLALYRAYNKPEQALLVYQSDFGAAMKDRSAQQYGRNYVGYWEARNLRMVSNIRDIVGITPGKRTLTIVGAAHKGYFEAYLNMMHDVKLVDTDTILR